MKKLPPLSLFLFLLSFVPSVSAQTVGVTGHTKIGNGNALTSGTFMRFRLRNFSGNTPRVIGTGAIVQTQFDVTPDNTGLVSTNIYANDDISPVNTFWTVEQWFNGVFVASYNYGICRAVQLSYCAGLNSLFNLDNQTPISFPTPPQPYLPIPGPAGPAGPQGPPGANGSPSGITIGPISVRGPDPWRDVNSYMPFNNGTFCSSTTPVNGADTTGTISAGQSALTLTAARDFKNGCGLEILNAGPTSTLAAPTLSANPTSASRSGQTVTLIFSGTILTASSFGTVGTGEAVSVTGCSNAAYNTFAMVQSETVSGGNNVVTYNVGSSGTDSATSCLAAFIYGSVHGVAGSTTYNYKLVKCDLNHGCSPASSTLTITGANATLSKNNYNYIAYPFDTNAALWLLYSDKGLGGALTCVNASVTMAMIDIGGYNPCPPYAPTNPPGAATAQSLFTTISSGGGTTTLTLAASASNTATTKNVYHNERSFLDSCIIDANNDTAVNGTQFGGGYGCYVPQGVYGMSTPPSMAALSPNGSVNIYVAGELNFQTDPWLILKPNYQIIGIGGGSQNGTVGQHKPMTAIKFGPNAPYGFVFGTASFQSSVKGFQMQYVNGTGIFIGATNPSNGTSGVGVEDMAIVEQGSSGNAPCVTIDDNNIGIYMTNVACQAPQQVGGMPCIYVTHTPSGSFVNQILRNNGVHCTFHGWKFDGPGGQAAQAAIHDISYQDSFSENLPNADIAQFQVDAQSNGFSSGGWALQGISLDHLISSDASAGATFVQMSPTSANNMPISAVEIKNSYLSGVAATCAVVTNCQQYPINGETSSGVGFASLPSNANGILSGVTLPGNANGVLAGGVFGVMPNTANMGNSPSTEIPFIVYMPPLTANNVSSTGAGSLAAGVYCNSFTGLDANNYETQPTPVTCQTVGASSDIIYDIGGPSGYTSAAIFSGFNFYYCFTASGTCTPNQKFSSISTVTDGGSGRLYTFSTTAGSSAATPALQGKAMMSWLAVDGGLPYSCFFCLNSSSDAWPIGIGMVPTANAGYNLYTKLGVNVGGNLKVANAVTMGLLDGTCYIDGTKWTSIQNAITSGTCGEINDRGVFATALGALTINRQVKILLGAATYTTTGIVMSSPAIIEGLSNATFLSYTPTSGNALALTGTQPNVPGDYSLRDLRFFGTGASSTSTGVFFNLTASNNTQAIFERVVIDSFGTGVSSAAGVNGVGFATFFHSSIYGNGQNINFPAGVSGERFELSDSNVNNTLAGTNWANCFSVASSSINIRILGGAIDYCQLSVSAGFVELGDGSYIEDTTSVIGTCTTTTSSGCVVAVSGTGIVTLNGILAFISGATNQAFAGVTGTGTLNVVGGTLNANGSGTVGPLVCSGSAGNLNMQPLPNLINGYVGAQLWAGGCTALNLAQSSAFGLPVSTVFGGTSSDVCNGWQNAHAGGVNWLECNGGTGAFAGTAGDIYFYNGTNSFLEFGGGINGLKMRGANLTPSVVNSTDIGSASLPFVNLWLGTAATNNFKFAPNSTTAARTVTLADPGANVTLPFVSATDTTTTHALFATATAGVYNSRAIATGDLPNIPLNQIISPTGAVTTIADGNNPVTVNCAQTTDSQDCWTFGETSAATGGTLTNLLANQAELHASTASGSTAVPLEVEQLGITATTGPPIAQFESTWNNASLVGQGIIENVTNTSSATGSLLENLRVGNVTQWSVDKVGNAKGTSFVSTGTQAVLSGTGACATITTQVGGGAAGSAKCTGTTAASTLTITFALTAPNGWACNVQDETTRANLFQQTSHTTTTCVLTVTSLTQNDVFVFSAEGF